jgi:fatty acyl-CoA reductase
MNVTEIDSLKEFYEDSEIFITGGSGYIGKVLIEKLLRSCTRVKKIYLLIRPRKGKNVDDRLQDIWDSMVRLLPKGASTFF